MPLILPGQTVTPIPLSDNDILRSGRVTDFRFDLLKRVADPSYPSGYNNEYLEGTLDGVSPGGSVSWEATAAIKGGGSIMVTDLGDGIDWLNVRIRPVAIVEAAGGGGELTEVNCGVFVPAAPKEVWDGLGRSWSVELLDKNSILDQDVVVDVTGQAITYALPVGTSVLTAITALISDLGEDATGLAIEAGAVLAADMVWDVGTSRLKIINDLLEAANYFSLWVDGNGLFTTSIYTSPATRGLDQGLLMLAPFVQGDDALMAPEWGRDQDIFSIPNRYIAIGQGDSANAASTATAQNVDDASPYSFNNRGRWITAVETGVEATDVTALAAYAQKKLENATSVTNAISITHAFLPDLIVNKVVEFVNADASLSLSATVTKTTITFDPLALCATELQEVIGAVSEA